MKKFLGVLLSLVVFSVSVSTALAGTEPLLPKPPLPPAAPSDREVSALVDVCANSTVTTTFDISYYGWQNLGNVTTANAILDVSIAFNPGSPAAEIKFRDSAGQETQKFIIDPSAPTARIILPHCGSWTIFISSNSWVYNTHGRIWVTGL